MVPYAGDAPRISNEWEQLRCEWTEQVRNAVWAQGREASPNRGWKKYEITILTLPQRQSSSTQRRLVRTLLNFSPPSLSVDANYACQENTRLSYPIIDARGNRRDRADRYCFTAYIREPDARETTAELSRWLDQQDYVLRHLVVRADERRVNRH